MLSLRAEIANAVRSGDQAKAHQARGTLAMEHVFRAVDVVLDEPYRTEEGLLDELEGYLIRRRDLEDLI